MTATTEAIKGFVVQNFYVPDPATLADDASLLDKGIVDSTGVLEITAFLEATYGIRIADTEIVPENLDTIARIVDFVNRKKQAVHAA